MLLVLNGAPGVGKSALAERYADDHPLALVIDIDDLRRRLGRWERVDASRQVARDLAVALAREHLRAGHDVVVPQYVGRREFVDRLRALADEVGAAFVEVVLLDRAEAVIERFRRRRSELAAAGVRHPEADLDDDAVDATIRAAAEDLLAVAGRLGLATIEVSAGLEASYRALCEVAVS